MARRVKCFVTKEYGTSDTFYKAPNKKYFKDEATYLEWKKTNELRDMCIKSICDVADYKLAPTFLNKIICEIGNAVGYDVLYETIQRDMEKFEWVNANKQFSSEIQRLCYYQSIIKNTVIDVYKEFQEKIEKENSIVPPENLDAGKVVLQGKDNISDILGDI